MITEQQLMQPETKTHPGTKLKELRHLAKISQMRLSQVTGVSRYKLSIAENGLGSLSEAEMETIREVLARLVGDAYQKIQSLQKTVEGRVE